MRPTLQQNATLRYLTFFNLYFMQGVPSGFALTALTNYMIGGGVSSLAVGTFVSVVGIPWIIQLVWGPFIDRYSRSLFKNYKHWVIFSQLLAFAASLLLLMVDDPLHQTSLLTTIFFVHSLFASVQDASVDALAISMTPTFEKGRVNAAMRCGLLLGISLGAAGLSIILHRFSFHHAAAAMSFLLLFFTILFILTPLSPKQNSTPDQQQDSAVMAPAPSSFASVFARLFQNLLSRQSLTLFSVVFYAYFCFSLFNRSTSFHLIHSLGWSDKELSVFQGSWGAVLTLVVVLSGGYMADKLHLKKMYYGTLSVLALFLFFFNAYLFRYSDSGVIKSGLLFWNLADPLLSVCSFPLLMAICDKKVSGSQFTAYMALINLADVLGALVSGWLLQTIFPPAVGFAASLSILFLLGVILTLRLKQRQFATDIAGRRGTL